jgi:hypothetical protein
VPGPAIEPAALAAIVAAVEATWPRPGVPEPTPAVEPSQWRFSARWWARPAVSRRTRPW